MAEIKKLKSKEEVFSYIIKKYSKLNIKGIAIIGSTAKGNIKEFSDFDVVVFNQKERKPEYELIQVNNKLTLLAVYFYKPGNKKKIPSNGKILFGEYFEQIEHPGHLKYTPSQRIKRNNQMFLDGLFKFLRSKDSHYLSWLEKYQNL